MHWQHRANSFTEGLLNIQIATLKYYRVAFISQLCSKLHLYTRQIIPCTCIFDVQTFFYSFAYHITEYTVIKLKKKLENPSNTYCNKCWQVHHCVEILWVFGQSQQ